MLEMNKYGLELQRQLQKERFDELSAKFPEFSSAVDDCYKYLSNVVETYKSVDAAVTGQQ